MFLNFISQKNLCGLLLYTHKNILRQDHAFTSPHHVTLWVLLTISHFRGRKSTTMCS